MTPTVTERRPAVARALVLATVLGAGLFVGVVAALLSATFGGRTPLAFATSVATCSDNTGQSTITVKLYGSTTQAAPDVLGIDTQNGYVYLNPGSSGAWIPCGPSTYTLGFSAQTGDTTEYVEFDMSSSSVSTIVSSTTYYYDGPVSSTGNCFNLASSSSSSIVTSGSAGGTLMLRDSNGGNMTVGASDLSLGNPGTGTPIANCASTPIPSGVSAMQLIGNGADTLSTAGESPDTTSYTTTTFTLGDPAAVSDPTSAGATRETIDAAYTYASTLDFSSATGTSCTSTTCSLTVNSSGAKQTLLPDRTTKVPAGTAASPSIANDTAYLSDPSGVEVYDFTATSNSSAPVVTKYAFNSSSYPVYFWGGTGGTTYTIPKLPSASEFGVVGAATLDSIASPVQASGATFWGGSGTDAYYVTSTTANTFHVGSGSDTFDDAGSTGNTIDFSALATSSNQLVVNTSGSTFTVGTSPNTVQLTNGQAVLGTSTVYTFQDGNSQTTDADFTNFVASQSGNTEFVAGDEFGLNFYGYANTTTDSALFNTTNGIIANLGNPIAKLGTIKVSSTLTSPISGGALGTGQVSIATNSGTHGLDSLFSIATDNIGSATNSPLGIYSVTGPGIGYSTFFSGSDAETYSFVGGSGGFNTFNGGTSTATTVTFTSGGQNNDFIAGQGNETFIETSTSQNPSNTLDFSSVATSSTQRLVINVSGANQTVTDYGAGILQTASGGTTGTLLTTDVYSFGSGGSQFNLIKGAANGYTTFQGGSGPYTYTGQGDNTTPGDASTNILDFSAIPSANVSTLTFDVSTPTNLVASVGGVPEQFKDITDLIGLKSGGTTFIAGAPSTLIGAGGNDIGFTFQGNGTNNTAEYLDSANINLTNSTVTDSDTESIAPDQAVIGPSSTTPVSCTASATQVAAYCVVMVSISNIIVGTPAANQAFTIFAGPAAETFSDQGGSTTTNHVTTPNDTDTLDFTYVSTGGNTGLTVDVSGGPSNGTATVGSVTYNFKSGSSAFTTLVGPKTGLATFVASPSTGYTYMANGSGNSIDFSAAASGVTVTYANSATQAGATVCIGATTCTAAGSYDIVTDITTVTGSSQGGNKFVADPNLPTSFTPTYSFTGLSNNNTFVGGAGGTETFISNGTGNTFSAGQSNEVFNDATAGNTVDLSKVGAPVTVNVTGGTAIGSVNNDTAATTSGTIYTYNFTSFGTDATVFYGSAATGTTTFYAGSEADTFEGEPSMTGMHPTTVVNILSYQFATGTTLTLSVGSQLACTSIGQAATDPSFGSAQLGSVGESFCGMTELDGLPGGSTAFIGSYTTTTGMTTTGHATGGYTFRGFGTGNSISFATWTAGTIKADLNAAVNTVTLNGVTGGTDYMYDITNVTGGLGGGTADSGANAAPGNDFIAGNQQNDTFNVPTGSTGNTVDFTHVQTSQSSLLIINLTGGPVQNQSNGTADISNFVYSFTGTAGAFTTFIGAGNGETHFLAGVGPLTGSPTYSFQTTMGTAGNLVDFTAVPDRLTARLDLGQVTWVNSTSPTTNTVTAYLVNVANVIGSSSATGGDVYTTGAGTYTISTSTGNNTFNLGSGSVTITDPNAGNIINFGGVGGALHLTGQLTVNVSGVPLGSVANDSATANGSTYTFSNEPTTFDTDLTGPTYFYVGPVGDTFTGPTTMQATSTNGVTLDYSQISPPGALTICVNGGALNPCTTGQITLGTVQQFFKNVVTNFIGLATGQTTFVANDTTTGLTFTGVGGTNTADFSNTSANSTLKVDLNAETTGAPTNDVTFTNVNTTATSNDTITDVSIVFGSANSANDFVAGQASETFKDLGTHKGAGNLDTIDFSNVITSGASLLSINVTGGIATGNGNVYNFAVGSPDFTTFDGSTEGNSTFIGPKNTGGYTFNGAGSNNTANFAANSIGVIVNLSGNTIGTTLASGAAVVDGVIADADTVNDVQLVIGSPSQANVFYGGLSGVEFESNYTFNTLSYYGLTTESVYLNEATSTVYQLNTASGQPFNLLPSDTYSLPGTVLFQGSNGGTDVYRVSSATTEIQGNGGSDTLDLGALNGVTVNMQLGSVTGNGGNGQAIGGITWGSSCAQCTLNLTIGAILGSQGADTYQLPSTALTATATPLTITPGSKSGNTIDLSYVTAPATVVMPVASASKPACTTTPTATGCGTVGAYTPVGTSLPAPTVVFYGGITNLTGTAAGGDTVYAGTGSESLNESGTTGSLSLAGLPGTPKTTDTGVTITVTDNAGIYQGTISSPVQVGLTATFTGFNNFVGTAGGDSFIQNGPSPTGGYTFAGGTGTNSVNLSNGVAGTTLTLADSAAPDACGSGFADGSVAQGTTVVDAFSCITKLTSTGSTFDVQPGLNVNLNGGGTGTLVLVPIPPATSVPSTQGAIINLLAGTVTSAFTGPNAYNFMFSGMSTIQGTTGNDTFIDGPGTFTLIGGGGSDAISYAGATSAAEVNLSNAPYLIPTGYSGAGTDLLAGTAQGGFAGSLTLQGISSVVGTSNFNDLLVGASSGVGSMIGGSGNDLFVLTGGFDYVTAGAGNSTLDLSQLTGNTRINLAASGPQYLGGDADGGVWILGGNISQIVASPGGSTLLGGAGNMTLQGGVGADTLVAGAGNQTLIGGGGSDTLVGGTGTDLLAGGAQQVTFQPGSGTDTLTSQTTGNTLTYVNAPKSVVVNLTSNSVAPPPPPPAATPGSPEVNSPSMALLQTFQNVTAAGNTATGGWGATVNLTNAGISTILGNGTSNLYVVGGNDVVNGGSGNDLFMVGGGNNTLTAGTNTQSVFMFISGGTGNAINGGGLSTVDFSQGTASVTVNLQAVLAPGGIPVSGTATGGFNGNPSSDNLVGIINVVGTQYTDSLIAGGAGGIIIGNGAVATSSTQSCGANCGDVLQSGPQGANVLEANTTGSASGNDTFCANSTAGSAAFCAATGTLAGGGDIMVGGTGNDTFFADMPIGDQIWGGGGFNVAFVGPHDPPPNQIQTTVTEKT